MAKRKSPRTELVLKVDYSTPKDLLADYLTDLGQGGLFICTSVHFEAGQDISFSLSFPGLLDPIELHGRVRWRRDASQCTAQQAPGVGVELDYQSEMHRQEIAKLIARAQAPAQETLARSSQPFRVLLVEDNLFAHDLFQHAVKKFHRELHGKRVLEIISAHNGQEALDRMADHAIDLAIVDFFLPVMTGDQLILELRKQKSFESTPILVISVGGEGVREEAMKAGADLYLDKPVLLKQMLTTLRVLLTGKSAEGGDGDGV